MTAKHLVLFGIVALLSIAAALWTAPLIFGEDPPAESTAKIVTPPSQDGPAAPLPAKPAPAGIPLLRPASAAGGVDAGTPLTGDSFRASMVALQPSIEACLAAWTQEMPDFSGRVLLSVVLQPDGLAEAKLEQCPAPSEAVQDCLAAAAWSATWPKAPGSMNLSYPFVAPGLGG